MKKTTVRRILLMVGLITIVSVFLGCAPTAPAPAPKATEAGKPAAAAKTQGPEIKIGYINPFTGVLADFGPRIRIAIDMAVKEVNAEGGINGVPIKILEGDSRSDEQEVIKLIQKFTSDDKVLALVGPFEAPGALVGFPHAVKAKTPIITSSPLMPGVGKDNQPWGFSLGLPDDQLFPPTAKAFLKQYPNVKKVASIYATDQGYLKGLGEYIPTVFKGLGVELLDPIFIKLGDTDFTAAVTRLKGQNADAVAITTSSQRAGPLAVEIRRQGINIPIVGSTVLADGSMIVTGGKAVEGAMSGTAYWDTNPEPLQVAHAKKYVERGKVENSKSPDPDGFTATNYDIIRALAKVMREGGITNRPEDLAKDREIIMNGVQKLKDFPGMGTKLTMGQDGQVVRDVFVVIVKDGKFERVPAN